MFSESTQLAFRVNTKDFSCQSAKLNFYPYVLLGISLLKNSLSVELYNLLNSNQLEPISKSAYSQGRYKIQAELYQAWHDLLVHLVYQAGVPLENMAGLFFGGN